ncbi:lactonase family protein [Haliscomenobacter hydrossis]|uniref:6-phosphogluconolactonase n=1 Tax=Haliscomenobacter hydrossis (strain ATCC 27775 / DSM 1100 / LMG 10767 / O) TaxID=760192 RepID=F4L6I6_HALH1|nr:lactonase family protein [Haliscomenobacter hydrossis]AEE49829.1 6-phosphogluconolactonase [Haliscomenobacter hydrossis DSM 1100]
MLKSILSSLFVIVAFLLQAQTYYVFVGAYVPNAADQGINVYVLDANTGQLQHKSLCPNQLNPSYLNISPNGKYLYAATEARVPKGGSVSSYVFDSISGKLTFINKQISGGENPVYVSVHKSGQWVVNANYSEASVSAYSVNANGSLNPPSQVLQYTEGSKVVQDRQAIAHTHSCVFSPKYDQVIVPDLGADKLRIFNFDPKAKEPLSPANPDGQASPAGSGPRHFAFHPNQKFAYCIEEMSGTVSAYRYKKGKLSSIQNIPAHPQEITTGFSGADIHASPDGRFLYASNRGNENNIAIYAIHPGKGTLTNVGYQTTFGNHPRNFTLDPTGKFLLVANMLSNSIVVFKRDVQTGLLSKVSMLEGILSPSCLKVRAYQN